MILTKIRYKKNKAVIDTDEGYSVILEQTTVLEHHLHEGDELTEEELTDVIRCDMKERAESLALKYVSYRLRSEKEVSDYLRGKDFDSEVCSSVVVRLRELGYLDDAEFAKAFVKDRLSLSKHGKSRIGFELKIKGIDPLIIQEVLQDIGASELQNAVLLIQKKSKDLSDFKEQRRISNMLARKGYSYDLISRAMSIAKMKEEHE